MLLLHFLLCFEFSLVLKADPGWTAVLQWFIHPFLLTSDQQFAALCDPSSKPLSIQGLTPPSILHWLMKCTCLFGGTVPQSLPEVITLYMVFFTPVKSHWPSLLLREVNWMCEAWPSFHYSALTPCMCSAFPQLYFNYWLESFLIQRLHMHICHFLIYPVVLYQLKALHHGEFTTDHVLRNLPFPIPMHKHTHTHALQRK